MKKYQMGAVFALSAFLATSQIGISAFAASSAESNPTGSTSSSDEKASDSTSKEQEPQAGEKQEMDNESEGFPVPIDAGDAALAMPIASVEPTTKLIQINTTITSDVTASKEAAVSQQTVKVNNKDIAMDVYNIDGFNYFKLRDIAMALDKTSDSFNVSWENGAITMELGTSYIPVGGELTVTADASAQTAMPVTAEFTDGQEKATLTAYNIKDNNYFQLREISDTLGLSVTFDEATQSISIETQVLNEELSEVDNQTNGVILPKPPTTTPEKQAPSDTPTEDKNKDENTAKTDELVTNDKQAASDAK